MKDLSETVELMESTDYSDRLKAEIYQLYIRMTRLQSMLKKHEEGTLPFEPTCPIELLKGQAVAMERYFQILMERARIEGVEIHLEA